MRLALLASMMAVAGSAVRCGACEPDKAPPPAASATASVAPPVPTVSAPSSHTAKPAPAPKLLCRAITVEGDVHVEPAAGKAPTNAGLTPVLVQGLVPADEGWLGLTKGARLVVKDPRTTRETAFRAVSGPARARACVGFAEESWLASGRFESSVGAGEAPGAEEWVVTPLGVVRYVAAKLVVDVLPRDTEVRLDSGEAFLWTPVTPTPAPMGADGRVRLALPVEEGWTRLPAGTTRLPSPESEPQAGVEGARRALERCQTLALSARTLAAEVMSPDAGADGGTIARQVTTRRLARAACALASLRIRGLPETDAAPMSRPLADANANWSGIPVATGP